MSFQRHIGHIGWAVMPGRGVGPVRFGMGESDITALLGVPLRAEVTPEGDRWLAYEGLDLHFHAEEGFRLASIELSAPSESTVSGHRLLGAPDGEWQEAFRQLGVRFTRVRRVEAEQEWESADGSSSVYSEEDRATAIMLCVCRDDRGEPIWPADLGSPPPQG